ncbi:hypothetical protein CR513_52084, partial [Mucuna pruriens]
MVGWTVQLFEFDISFERRDHIKAQALADFITKSTKETGMERSSSYLLTRRQIREEVEWVLS